MRGILEVLYCLTSIVSIIWRSYASRPVGLEASFAVMNFILVTTIAVTARTNGHNFRGNLDECRSRRGPNHEEGAHFDQSHRLSCMDKTRHSMLLSHSVYSGGFRVAHESHAFREAEIIRRAHLSKVSPNPCKLATSWISIGYNPFLHCAAQRGT